MANKKRLILFIAASVGMTSVVQADNQGAAQAVTQAAAGAVGNAVDNNGPDWLKRTDVSIEGMEHSKPTWSVETIQPLFQTPSTLQDTVFFQGRWGDRNSDNTVNLGLGYRRLLSDGTWLFGTNAFFDTTTKHSHQRVGIGGEAIGQYMTLRANYYDAISGEKTISTIGGVTTTEKALNGYDFEIDAPMPYLPWMRVAATSYHWNSATSGLANVRGDKLMLSGNITSSLSMELGRMDDNYRPAETFVRLIYNIGATPTNGTESTLFDGIKPASAFEARDLSRHTLDKVQRQNDIVVETKRSGGGGITIGRRN